MHQLVFCLYILGCVGIACAGINYCFAKTKYSHLVGFNDNILKVKKPKDCETICREQTDFECRSFSYNRFTRICFFSSHTAKSRPTFFATGNGQYHYYEKQICRFSDQSSSCRQSDMVPFRDHCYRAILIEMEALGGELRICKDGNGYMVAIESQEEFEFIVALISEAQYSTAEGVSFDQWWTGSFRLYRTWYDSKPTDIKRMEWSKWLKGEPSPYYDYATLAVKDGVWGLKSEESTTKFPTICEYE